MLVIGMGQYPGVSQRGVWWLSGVGKLGAGLGFGGWWSSEGQSRWGNTTTAQPMRLVFTKHSLLLFIPSAADFGKASLVSTQKKVEDF